MFFLGFKNALFVGFAIPMSMFMSLMILGWMGYTLNTMILFGLIMGLGMLVDNGIVVVENVYRLMDEEGLSRIDAAKKRNWRNCISYYYFYSNYGSCIYTPRIMARANGAIYDLFPYHAICGIRVLIICCHFL
jgi:hypothetical protein